MTEANEQGNEQNVKTFSLDMPLSQAMDMHPDARAVFAAFQLGGCSMCSMAQFETIGQACEKYGLDSEALLKALEDLTTE